MKKIITLTSVYVLLISGCASRATVINNLGLGIRKSQVVQKLGDPQRKYRRNGKDHWIYETYIKPKDGSKNYLTYFHILSFEFGELVEKSFKRSFTEQELKQFQEFERQMKLKK